MSNAQQNISMNGQGPKIIIAFCAAAIAPAIVLSAIVYFRMISSVIFSDYRQTWLQIAGSAIGLGVVTFIVAFMHLFILGIPLFLLGLRLKMIRWWTTLIGAFIVGSLPCIGIGVFFNEGIPGSSFSSVLGDTIIFGLFGMSGGIVFWLLWRYWILPKSSNNLDADH